VDLKSQDTRPQILRLLIEQPDVVRRVCVVSANPEAAADIMGQGFTSLGVHPMTFHVNECRQLIENLAAAEGRSVFISCGEEFFDDEGSRSILRALCDRMEGDSDTVFLDEDLIALPRLERLVLFVRDPREDPSLGNRFYVI
jgi:hypothetical protein